MKYSLKSDYCELAHPYVLDAFNAAGTTQFDGYGLDEYSKRASVLIKEMIENTNADVHFVCGGTQANLLVVSSALRPHEAVIAADTGHICVHETGAIEATGHKVCTVPDRDGKLSAGEDGILSVVHEHSDEHMVLPKMVYISQSTEKGTVYTKAELEAIAAVCREHKLYLYIDGARLGAALNSQQCDLTYAGIAKLADAFYIGGTKNGALFGEAIVIVNDALKENFRYIIKQKGALISKGAAIGIQFEALFKDGLYDKLAAKSNAAALKLAEGIKKAGYSFLHPVQTNMLYPVFPSDVAARLHERFEFYDWHQSAGNGATDGTTTARLVTSWATQESVIDEFTAML